MKISVSLPQEDIAFVDDYAARQNSDSRSAVIQAAIELLRQSQLEQHYEAAFAEWEDEGDEAGFWDRFSADGLRDETR